MSLPEFSGKYTSAFRLLIVVVILTAILYFGRALFIPMSFGLLIAVICYPFCKWLESKGLRRALAVSFSMGLVVILFGSLMALLIYEINLLAQSQSEITGKLQDHFPDIGAWLQRKLGVSQEAQDGFMLRMMGGLENNIGSSVNVFLSATASTLLSLILIPIFSFLFLLHRRVFVRFLEVVAGEKHRNNLRVILNESVHTYYQFARGTFFVYCIVGCLNSVGLLALESITQYYSE